MSFSSNSPIRLLTAPGEPWQVAISKSPQAARLRAFYGIELASKTAYSLQEFHFLRWCEDMASLLFRGYLLHRFEVLQQNHCTDVADESPSRSSQYDEDALAAFAPCGRGRDLWFGQNALTVRESESGIQTPHAEICMPRVFQSGVEFAGRRARGVSRARHHSRREFPARSKVVRNRSSQHFMQSSSLHPSYTIPR